MDKCKVYYLKNKNLDEIKYIGITSKTLDYRLNEHLRDIKRSNVKTYKKNWLISVINSGSEVQIILLDDNLSIENAKLKEISYIRDFKEKGFKLVNGTLGGDGVVCTEEVRLKMSKSNIGKVRSKECIEKMRLISTGRKLSVETKLKMSKTHKRIGTKPIMNDETKLKMSLSRKGKISPRKGVILSDETKKKISDSKKIAGLSTNSRKIVQLSIDENEINRFKSIKEAEFITGIGNISRCLSGKRKTVNNFIWRYL